MFSITAPIAGGYKRLKLWRVGRIKVLSWSQALHHTLQICRFPISTLNIVVPLFSTIFASRDPPLEGFARYRHDGHY